MAVETQSRKSSGKALDFLEATKPKFKRSLENAVSFAMSGGVKREDNIELYLNEEDKKNLSPLIPIINNAWLDYKRGDISKVRSMQSMLLDSYSGLDYGIGMLMVKADEITEVLKYYRDVSAMLEERIHGKSISSKHSLVPPLDSEPINPLDFRTYEQLKDTMDEIKKNKDNVDIGTLKDFKKRCEQKYAQTCGECGWVMDTYSGY